MSLRSKPTLTVLTAVSASRARNSRNTASPMWKRVPAVPPGQERTTTLSTTGGFASCATLKWALSTLILLPAESKTIARTNSSLPSDCPIGIAKSKVGTGRSAQFPEDGRRTSRPGRLMMGAVPPTCHSSTLTVTCAPSTSARPPTTARIADPA